MFIDPAVQSFKAGSAHMEAGFSEIANANGVGDAVIGSLEVVAATGEGVGAVLSLTPEGKVEKLATEGAEKLATNEGEKAATKGAEEVAQKGELSTAKTVEKKTEGQVSASAKADTEKAAATTDKSTDKTYQTYTKPNPETGEVYTGRTSGTGTPEENIADRDASHHMNDKGFGPAKLDKSSSNPDAIRGREQQQIEANGGAKSQGGTSGNAINGVSPTNPKAQQYQDAANKEFGDN